MKKVKLILDELAVESFEATPGLDEQGTVAGYASENTDCNTACLGTCNLQQCRSILTGLCCNN